MTSAIKAEALGLADDMDLRVGDRVTLRISNWSRKQAGLFSRVITGELTVVTPKGLRFCGTVSVEGAEHCHRCGLPIRHAASLIVGYGPICGDYLGIDWSRIAADLTPEQAEAIRERIRVAGHTDNIDKAGVWLPRSRTAVLSLERSELPSLRDSLEADNARLARLIIAKTGDATSIEEDNAARRKCLAYIERKFGNWFDLDAVQRNLVLLELEECPPAKNKLAPVAPAPVAAKAPLVRAWVAGDAIFVQSPYSPANVAVSRSIMWGRWEPVQKAWRYPAKADSAHRIVEKWRAAGLAVGGDDAFLALLGQTVEAPADVAEVEALEEI